ncbi:MAG: beta-ketoacyl-ACP synthase II [Deltaproteobacteria bacterium]|nr:beta-ketoacyl-ACP synthase II [Deltaproteobacteria bacterium]
MAQLARQTNPRRVVVTGLGLVTPLGTGVSPSWEGVCAGKSGIGPITRFDASAMPARIAGEVLDFHAEDFLPKKEARRTEPHIAYSVAAGRMAVEAAGLSGGGFDPDRAGVFLGCGLGGLGLLEKTHETLLSRGPARVSPFFIPMMIGNMAPGVVSMQLGFKGPNCCTATACAAGTHALGEAFRMIESNMADVMLAGGVESVITPLCVAGFCAMRALSTRNDEPERASRPFDAGRDGFVVGEGAGILLLEEEEHAKRRGAPILARVAGYGATGDAHHFTAPGPGGEGMARCMRMALADAGMEGHEIAYINAHGTSTPLNDEFETIAIRSVFGQHAQKLAISSTKSMTGHLLGGAGGVEAAFTVLAIKDGIIPPTINLEHPDEACGGLDFVPHKARKRTIAAAMSNSFGFGGTNGVLIFTAPDFSG